MANDDFGAQLGSMDRNQLKELMAYLGDASLGQKQVYGSAGGGLGYRPSWNGNDWGGVGKGAATGAAAGAMAGSVVPVLGTAVGGVVGGVVGAGMGVYNKYAGNRKQRKNQAEYESQKAKAISDQNLVNQGRLKSVQQQLQTLDTRDKVNQQFQDLNLEGLFDRVSKQGLASNIQGITQQHADLSRESGFQTASQGLGGSSVDATRAADVQSSQNQAIAQAAAQSQGQRASMTANANSQRQNLLNSVSGANPGEDARMQNEIQGIGQSASAYGNQSGLQGFGMQQNQQNQNGYSQALGGMLTNYANMYTMQNQNRPSSRATPGYGVG